MSIQNYLNQIKTAVFGKDVRQSIHDAIKQCYDDASVDHDNANMEVKLARGTHETLNDRITENEKNQENLSSQLDKNTSELNNNKSNISVLNNQIKSIANGSPKGVYPTVSDLNIAFPTGNNNVYVVSSDGGWYYWNGSTWTKGGTYQSTEIADRSIGSNKVKFVDTSRNLFDYSKVTKSYGLNVSNGALISNSSMMVSDYIEVVENTPYLTNKEYMNVCYYDVNKSFISGFTVNSNYNSGEIHTTPTNCRFIRLAIDINNYTFILKKGIAGFDGYNSSDYCNISNKNIEVNSIDGGKIVNRSIGSNKVEFVDVSRNLFNKEKCTDNFYINPSNGRILGNSELSLSDIIKVYPNTVYTLNLAYCQITYYDVKGIYISSISYSDLKSTFLQITTPTNCEYIRVAIKIDKKDIFQIEKGNVKTKYQNYSDCNIDGENIKDATINIGKLDTNVTRKDTKFEFGNFSNTFTGNIGKIIVHGDCIPKSGYVELLIDMAMSTSLTLFIVELVGDSFTIKDKMIVSLSEGVNEVKTYFNAKGNGKEYIGFLKGSQNAQKFLTAYNNDVGYYTSNEVNNGDVGNVFTATKDNNALFGIDFIRKSINIFYRWEGKTMNCLGDSLTQGDVKGTGALGIPWTMYIKNILKLNSCKNYGISGTLLGGTGGNAMVNRYDSMEEADIICVWGGTNDFCTGLPIGNLNDDTVNTFYGSLNILIKGLYNKYPNSEIFFITPPKINKSELGETFTPNSVGFTLKDYRDAIINACDKHSIPVLDFYSNLGMSAYLDNGENRPDKLHFTNKAYKRIAYKIASFVNML